MFHKVKSVVPTEKYQLLIEFSEGIRKIYDVNNLIKETDMFSPLGNITGLFEQVTVDVGGYGISWNDDIDISCNELWENGQRVPSDFDNLLSFSDATALWKLNESTLRKATSYGKLIEGRDVKKFGKQWVVTFSAMLREYGNPPE